MKLKLPKILLSDSVEQNSMDALALYYLIRLRHRNGVVYNFKPRHHAREWSMAPRRLIRAVTQGTGRFFILDGRHLCTRGIHRLYPGLKKHDWLTLHLEEEDTFDIIKSKLYNKIAIEKYSLQEKAYRGKDTRILGRKVMQKTKIDQTPDKYETAHRPVYTLRGLSLVWGKSMSQVYRMLLKQKARGMIEIVKDVRPITGVRPSKIAVKALRELYYGHFWTQGGKIFVNRGMLIRFCYAV
jgi:hypothetical protein